MQLPLDQNVLDRHIQKYPNSCVPMGVEMVLKLMGAMDINSYILQDEKGDESRWGGDYTGKTISNVFIEMKYNEQRGPKFPLEDLFSTIKSELDFGRFVNCAWRPSIQQKYHAYVIYGYSGEEFLAITKDYMNPQIQYIPNMKSRLKDIQGSDILTFLPKI